MANVFDLQAKIGLNTDDFKKGLSNAGNAMKSIATGIGNMVKVGVAGFSAISAGVGALTKQSIEAYANYEQLAGGTELLFGEASDFVMEKSKEAYKNVQMSQNDYLEQVNGFSTGLKTALGGNVQAAAELADKIVTAEADVVAATGVAQESVQNAFNGIMKSNFTMLDNLQLGITPTKEGFQEVIDKVNAWKAENGEATNYVIDNLADCQSALVDYIEMQGLAGYATNEAAGTITGSISMMKGAWENLISGVSDESSDFDTLVSNFIESVDAVAGNIMPRIEIALQGVGKLVEKLVPTILDRLPDLILNTLPALISSASKLVKALGESLVDNLPTLLGSVRDLLFSVIMSLKGDSEIGNGFAEVMKTLGKYIPQISQYLFMLGTQIFEAIINGISENADMFLETLTSMLTDVIGMVSTLAPVLLELGLNLLMQIGQSIVENMPMLIDTAITLVQQFAQFIADNAPTMMPQIVDMVYTIIEMLTDPENIGLLIDAAIVMTNALLEGFINGMPKVLEHAPVIIENYVTALTENFPKLMKCAGDAIKTIVNGFLVNAPQMLEVAKAILDQIGYGFVANFITLKESAKSAFNVIKDVFVESCKMSLEWGKDLIDNFIGGIKEKISKLKDTVSDVAQSVKDFLGFSEPKAGPLSNFHTYAPDMMQLFAEGIKDNTKKVTSQLNDSLSDVTGEFDSASGNASGGTGMGVNNYYITVTSGTISSDYDARRAAQIMSEELGTLKNMERMAVGG